MKFGQVIKHNKRTNFYKNHLEDKAKRLVLDLFLFFKKALFDVNAIGLQSST